MACWRGASKGRPLRTLALGLLALAAGACASGEDAGAGLQGNYNPWVQGGQTGALDCGPTPAAAMGAAIPAGDGGILLRVSGCELGFDPAAISLTDAAGEPVEFDVERLDDDNVLLVPQMGLGEGTYTIDGMAIETDADADAGAEAAMAPQAETAAAADTVQVAQEAELPMQLGTLEPRAGGCGAPVFRLTLDPAVLAYLPHLKLSVSVDGGPTETFFDYGTLQVVDGQATIELPECLSACIDTGMHQLVLIAEIAGEPGTLEPIEVAFEVDCPEGDSWDGCRAAGDGGDPPWSAALAVAALLAWRRRRRRPSG
jgi:MYXO-CTERM domain-containing protein